jgi:hypothetical protein
MLVYGYIATGEQFWVYIAVPPSKLDVFNYAMSTNQLDAARLPEYGNIIVSGIGPTPPENITRKVAEMFNIDPSTLFKQVDMKAELEHKINSLINPNE